MGIVRVRGERKASQGRNLRPYSRKSTLYLLSFNTCEFHHIPAQGMVAGPDTSARAEDISSAVTKYQSLLCTTDVSTRKRVKSPHLFNSTQSGMPL